MFPALFEINLSKIASCGITFLYASSVESSGTPGFIYASNNFVICLKFYLYHARSGYRDIFLNTEKLVANNCDDIARLKEYILGGLQSALKVVKNHRGFTAIKSLVCSFRQFYENSKLCWCFISKLIYKRMRHDVKR